MMEGMDLIVIGDAKRAVDEAICLSKTGNDVKMVNHGDKIRIGAEEKMNCEKTESNWSKALREKPSKANRLRCS
jgi:thioredoxin reductase